MQNCAGCITVLTKVLADSRRDDFGWVRRARVRVQAAAEGFGPLLGVSGVSRVGDEPRRLGRIDRFWATKWSRCGIGLVLADIPKAALQ
jgi:hypothetical protein